MTTQVEYKPECCSVCGTGEFDNNGNKEKFSSWARDKNDKPICYNCAGEMDLSYFREHGRLTCYVNSDFSEVITWPGRKLGGIYHHHECKHNFYNTEKVYICGKIAGVEFWGYAWAGGGGYCRIRAYKDKLGNFDSSKVDWLG